MLAIDQLTVTYPHQTHPALHHLSLAIEGSACVLGPSGAGKSTLFKALIGLVQPRLGGMWLDGSRLNGRPIKARRQIAYVPQENALPGESTLSEYLMELAQLDRFPQPHQSKAVKNIVELVHLSGALKKRMKWLSGGMKRRALIAGALLRDTPWLLMDEPTLGLDPDEQASIRALIRQLCRHRHVILATQFVEDAGTIPERLIILRQGHILTETNWESLGKAAQGHIVLQPPIPSLTTPPLFWTPLRGNQGVRAFMIHPPQDAPLLEPRPEDGYLWLVKTAQEPHHDG